MFWVNFWQVWLFEWESRLGFRGCMVSWDGPITCAKGFREEKHALKCWCAGVKTTPGRAAKGGCWEPAASLVCSWGRVWSRCGTLPHQTACSYNYVHFTRLLLAFGLEEVISMLHERIIAWTNRAFLPLPSLLNHLVNCDNILSWCPTEIKDNSHPFPFMTLV